MIQRYRRFFAHPGTKALATAGFLGRLPSGMLGLAFVLVAVEDAQSYAVGGAAAAVLTVAMVVAGPLWSRSVDRVGPAPILTGTALCQGAALTVTAVLSAADRLDIPSLLALTAVTGVFMPPLGATMRTLWSRRFEGSELKSTAFALESVIVDLAFILGPSAVAALAALGSPAAALGAAAAAIVFGCLIVAAVSKKLHVNRSGGGEEQRHWLGPLRSAAVRGVLPAGFLLMGSITVIEVSLVAFADQTGNRNTSGLLIAVLSVGGVTGGLVWGGLNHKRPNAQMLWWLLLLITIGWAMLIVAPNAIVLAVLLAAAGFVMTPAITGLFSTLEEVAPPKSMTESFGWLNSISAAGSAAGAGVVGLVVADSARPGFLLAAGMCATAALCALAFRRVWQRRLAPSEDGQGMTK